MAGHRYDLACGSAVEQIPEHLLHGHLLDHNNHTHHHEVGPGLVVCCPNHGQNYFWVALVGGSYHKPEVGNDGPVMGTGPADDHHTALAELEDHGSPIVEEHQVHEDDIPAGCNYCQRIAMVSQAANQRAERGGKTKRSTVEHSSPTQESNNQL